MFRAVLASLFMALGVRTALGGELKNVLGGALDTCSKPGMALTGFTRDGHCQDEGDDDAGAHHICIEMKRDFCTVTGQPDWCEEDMECMGQAGTCPIGNWCVCQWAFARYLKMAGGCDSIVDLVCEATNMAAVKAYKAQAASDADIQAALECLEQKCPGADAAIAAQRLSDASVPPLESPVTEARTYGFGLMAMCSGAVLSALGAAALAAARLRQGSGQLLQDVEREAVQVE